MEDIVFLEPTDAASGRTKWRLKIYGKRGWKILASKDSVSCLKGAAAGTLVLSVDVPEGHYQPWRGWLPSSEIRICGTKAKKD